MPAAVAPGSADDGRHGAVAMAEEHLRGDRAAEIGQITGQLDQQIVDREHPHEPPGVGDRQPADGVERSTE